MCCSLIVGLLAAAVVPQAAGQASVTAFVGVAVVPMDRERVLHNQTVLVRGDRIVALGPVAQVPVPAAAMRIDARGKYLIPGLADMHVHLVYPSQDTATAADILFAFVANGVTTVRDMHSGRRQGADLSTDQSWRFALRQRVASGAVFGPRIYTAGDPDRRSPEAAAHSIEALKADGHDFVKVSLFDDGSPQERVLYDSIIAAATRVGLPVVGHVPAQVGFAQVLSARWASTEHLFQYAEYLLGLNGRWSFTPLCCPSGGMAVADTAPWMQPGYRLNPVHLRTLAAEVRQAGVWSTPTLYILESFLGNAREKTREEVKSYSRRKTDSLSVRGSGRGQGDSTPSPSQRLPDSVQVARVTLTVKVLTRLLEFNRQITKALADAGAGILLGTDVNFGGMIPGFSVLGELAALRRAGLTPYQALATATRNPAVLLGTLDSTGTVAVGKRADLVLLNGNPLQDLRHVAGPAGVMVGGQWLPRALIEARLDSFPPGEVSPIDEGFQNSGIWQARQRWWSTVADEHRLSRVPGRQE